MSNAFSIASNAFDAEDFELILRALDTLDRHMQTELAKGGKDPKRGDLIGTRSRILVVRTKLQAIRSERPQVQSAAGTEHTEAQERLETLKNAFENEIGKLHKTHALAVAAQFAANHECEFDVSDALAVIADRILESIETLDRLCTEASSHAQ